jgi:internalin A
MGKEEALRRIKEAAETGATGLALHRLQLTELPPEVFQLTNLTWLNLWDNQLEELPTKIVQLINLTVLHLGYNKLNTLPTELFQLKNLTVLGIRGLELTSLPPEIVDLTNLTKLYLGYNPLVCPPYELALEGIPAIREYFASLEEGKQELAEVKLILIGEGASGKTSLTKLLCGQPFDQHEPMTNGIRIGQWTAASSSREVRCNLWDFGGQEIMHATHQFFLSRRSLYVLVLDGRRDERPEHWLRYIETFGGRSPVLVVLNKSDIYPSFNLNRPFLERKYPFIKGFFKTSCATGEGVAEFIQALHQEINQLLLTKYVWPVSWFRVKQSLEASNEPRISCENFEKVCLHAGVRGKTSQEVLVSFLHDLGAVIHFDDFALSDHHVLNPKWVTGAVYRIINDPTVAKANGLLKLDDLKEILAWQEGDEHRYYPADYVYIVELMKKFELCYDVAANEVAANEVLIPDLLEVPEPAFTFDERAALRLVLAYEDFFPPSIMPRFIVKRHNEIKDNLRWRSGVVLETPQLKAVAVVRADSEKKCIQIMVTGKERKVFLALLWLAFRELHTGFEGLKVDELIPMPDDPTIIVDYETLLNSQQEGIPKIFPKGAKKAYSVQELLAGVHFDDQSEGARMLALAKTESKSGLRWLGEKLNRYFEVENIKIFGIKIKHQAIFEDILPKQTGHQDGV